MEETGKPWPECVPLVQMQMHIMPAEGHSLTPFEILYGRPYYIPDLLRKDAPDSDWTLADYMEKP